jgi:phospholipase C
MTYERPPKSQGRRTFLRRSGKAVALAGVARVLPACVQEALSIPASRVTATIKDVQHVVILVQENRSFDHYFGTMSGVRGFADRHVVPLLNGGNVWQQSDGTKDILPFHLDTRTTTAMRIPHTPHTWPDSQLAWDQGRFGFWALHKQFQSMGYYEEDDIPFQRALAHAFTICDAYHCSLHAGTLPNRTVLLTGTNVKPGLGRAAVDQSEALIDNTNNRGRALGMYDWTTYPERLQQAGVSWRVYQDPLANWDGYFAPWESFTQYQLASVGEPLHQQAMKHWSLLEFADHVQSATLPQVSWIIPPPVWSEHPLMSSPLQGASYTQQVLEALVANPDVWSKTVFIVTFDENEGFFDHVPPPAVPSYAADGSRLGKTTLEDGLDAEYYTNEIGGVTASRPYGMGPRVPAYILSPWSRGGWVSSEVFDHTSTIRFLEARFGVMEPNITPWRRAVAGDLTRCFDFAHPNDAQLPALPDMSHATGDALIIEGLPPVTLPAEQALPGQDPGVRYSRPVPYALHTHLVQRPWADALELSFENTGLSAAVFHVYDRLHLDRLPRRYTVEGSKSLNDTWSTRLDAGRYDLLILAPNGYARYFAGTLNAPLAPHAAVPEVRLTYQPRLAEIELLAWNDGAAPCTLKIASSVYPTAALAIILGAHGGVARQRLDVAPQGHWYDITITTDSLPGWSRRFAGRMETGSSSVTDPALGTSR